MKNKFTVNKYGLRKMVTMVHPDLSPSEQMSTVENAWDIWKETTHGMEYDYFNLQFILWFWMSLNADADQLEKYAPRVSQEVQAAYWRAWGECQKAKALANEIVSEVVDELLADAVENLESWIADNSLARPLSDVMEDLLGDIDQDPRIPISRNICGDDDCWLCNSIMGE
jgi:hypothetical protein